MLQIPVSMHSGIEHEILQRVRAIAPKFSERAAESERVRHISTESVHELLDAGITRTLVPRHFGGYGLGIEAWYDIVREISRADASHGWCASIMMHHAHVVGSFPAEAQEAVWAVGPDVAIAASIMPTAHISSTEGGYFVTTEQSAFASGVGHSSWAIVGGLVHDGEASEWILFLVPAGEFQIKDTWFTTGMGGTGSNTIIISDRIFVPKERTLRVA
jgi:3-hydroxy-9,10-secoandrosta-1,3,5(10)-triene-9,17-dione monooxygenase